MLLQSLKIVFFPPIRMVHLFRFVTSAAVPVKCSVSRSGRQSQRRRRSGSSACAASRSGRLESPAPGCTASGTQPRHITLSRARSRLDRSRFLQSRPHSAAFFEIYKKTIFSRGNFANFSKILPKFCKVLSFRKIFNF